MIVLNLSPGPAIDYGSVNAMPDLQSMTGEWTPPARPVLEHNRLGVTDHYYGGMLDAHAM